MLYHTVLLFSLEVSVCGCPSLSVSSGSCGFCHCWTVFPGALSPAHSAHLSISSLSLLSPAPLRLYHFVSLLALSGPCLYGLRLFYLFFPFPSPSSDFLSPPEHCLT